MTDAQLRDRYLAYIECLNSRNMAGLGRFVAGNVRYNAEEVGLQGYRDMLERDFRDIPDLRFGVELLMCDDRRTAARLLFDCTPVGTFLGLRIDGRRVRFAENVFYEWAGDRIAEVWSVIDKAALEEQLR